MQNGLIARLLTTAVWAASSLSCYAGQPGKGGLGVNMNTLDATSTQIPFVDIFRQSAPFRFEKKWVSRDAKSDQTVSSLAPDHWVANLAYNEQAVSCVFNNNTGSYPSGLYDVFYNGDGDLIFYGANIHDRTPGHIVINVEPRKTHGWKHLCIVETRTNPDNPLRNISVVLPGYGDKFGKDPWYPPFLERLRPFSIIRFMDWMLTNQNGDVSWDDRRKADDATQASLQDWRPLKGQGVALEYQIDLANRIDADPWFNVPATASDEYVRQMATLVKERLRPELRPIIELSNEVFNSFPASYDYAIAQARELGLPPGPSGNGLYSWYAHRAAQIFDIWNDVFGRDAARLVHVVTGRRGFQSVNEYILSYRELYRKTDILAVDGYIMPFNIWEPPIKDGTMRWADVAVMSTPDLLQAMHRYIDSNLAPSWRESAALAKKFGVGLAVYEGGDGNVAAHQTEDVRVANLFIRAARDPGMQDVYTHLLDAWTGVEGATFFVHYNYVGPSSKFGCWGMFEYQDQETATAPKFQALSSWAAQHSRR